MKDDILEVISIGRITDIATGDFIYQIQFGKMLDVDEQMRKLFPQPAGSALIKQQASIVLVLNAGFDKAAPYRVGSHWTLSIDSRGNITLKEVKE